MAMAELLLLMIVAIGFGIMFGWSPEPKRLIYLLVWFIVAPTLLICAAQRALAAYQDFPFSERLLLIIAVSFAALFILSVLLPKAGWLKRLNAALFELFLFTITLPVRVLWRSVRLIYTRERHVRHLSAVEAIVGNRPPLRQAPSQPDESR